MGRGWSLSFVGNRDREVLAEWQDVLLDLGFPEYRDVDGLARALVGAAPDPEVRRQILVDNPARLYWADDP
jgi:hypothetical protein